MPFCVGSIIRRACLAAILKHRRKDYADRMSSWITAGVSECPDLLEINDGVSSLFKELARSGMLQRLVFFDKATRESPPPLERLAGALYQQHFNITSSVAK